MRRVALLFWFASMMSAQIQFDAGRKIWLISTPHSSYAMGVGPSGELQHLYWGGPLWRMEDLAPARRAARHLLF